MQEEPEDDEGAVPEEGRQWLVAVVERLVEVRLPVDARAASAPVDHREDDVDRRVQLRHVEV